MSTTANEATTANDGNAGKFYSILFYATNVFLDYVMYVGQQQQQQTMHQQQGETRQVSSPRYVFF